MIDYDHPKSWCTCKHLGDGPDSEHAGSDPVAGHGVCLVEDCPCIKFTWKSFTAQFHRVLEAQKG